MPEDPTFRSMARAHPARTTLLTAVPALLTVAQGLNSVFNGLHPGYALAFGLAMVGFVVGSTRQQLASFRTDSLEESAFDDSR